jgi:hypothetical protein
MVLLAPYLAAGSVAPGPASHTLAPCVYPPACSQHSNYYYQHVQHARSKKKAGGGPRVGKCTVRRPCSSEQRGFGAPVWFSELT